MMWEGFACTYTHASADTKAAARSASRSPAPRSPPTSGAGRPARPKRLRRPADQVHTARAFAAREPQRSGCSGCCSGAQRAAHLVAGEQRNGLHRLANAHLVREQQAPAARQAEAHALALERQQRGGQVRGQRGEARRRFCGRLAPARAPGAGGPQGASAPATCSLLTACIKMPVHIRSCRPPRASAVPWRGRPP
jgi:hypothetical protein